MKWFLMFGKDLMLSVLKLFMSDSCSSFCEQAVDGRKKKLIEKVFGWKKNVL